MKRFTSILLTILLMLTLCSCGRGYQRFTSTFTGVFDTVTTITAYDTSQSEFDAHLEQLKKMLDEYNRLYDIYNSYDGITNLKDINEKAGESPIKADGKIIDLLEYGKKVYELSGGKTNICLGTVLEIWHISRENKTVPDMKELKLAFEHTDINSLVINKKKGTVYFSDPELKLDVGAIAKGYAAEKVCSFAKEELWSAAVISIGGNVCTYGYKNNDQKTLWNIQIENPDESASSPLETLSITDMSVVTSGDYQRYFEAGGKRYHHIIDPDTLMPSEYFSSVTVICKDSARADALSTTLFNMPLDEGKKLIEKTDGAYAVWVDKNYKKIYSKGLTSLKIGGL